MPIPNPEPGLVISYAYLWHHEHQAGREEGQKDRPSVIDLAIVREADGAIVVTVLPITHSAHRDPVGAKRCDPRIGTWMPATAAGKSELGLGRVKM